MLDGAHLGSTSLDGRTTRGIGNKLAQGGNLGATLQIYTTKDDTSVILSGTYSHIYLQSCMQTLTLERYWSGKSTLFNSHYDKFLLYLWQRYKFSQKKLLFLLGILRDYEYQRAKKRNK